MHLNPIFRKTPAGFTIIELLTVISVIAVLTAIMIPTVSNIRLKAMRTESLSNLRQIYNAFVLFANDHEGQLPNAWIAANPEFDRPQGGWRGQIVNGGYLQDRDVAAASGASHGYSVLGSPVQRRIASAFTTDLNPPRMNTYGMNGRLNQVNVQVSTVHFTFANFLNPSRTFLVSSGRSNDQQWFGLSVEPWQEPNFTDRYIEVLYADGHVGTMLLAEFPGDPLPRPQGSDAWFFWQGVE